jgi:hypothetical protein
MTESTTQPLRRCPFEVSERVEHVTQVQIRTPRDDRVRAPPQGLHALRPSALFMRKLGRVHRKGFSPWVAKRRSGRESEQTTWSVDS